jgi:hypothetical protein
MPSFLSGSWVPEIRRNLRKLILNRHIFGGCDVGKPVLAREWVAPELTAAV